METSARKPSKVNRYQRDEYKSYLVEQQKSLSAIAMSAAFQSRKSPYPLGAKFMSRKEQNILTKWKSRQNDWMSIENELTKRFHCDKSTTSLMSKIDEFRVKYEDYESHDRHLCDEQYLNHIWSRTLRGGTSRHIQLGSLFSGLFCEIERSHSRRFPTIIRNPRCKTTPNIILDDCQEEIDDDDLHFEDSSECDLNISLRRSFQPQSSNICRLCVQTINLFDWAMSSTSQYFEQLDAAENLIAKRFEEERSELSCCTMQYAGIKWLQPTTQFFMSAFPGEFGVTCIQFYNFSSIQIEFRMVPKPTVNNANKNSVFRCVPDSGIVKPNELGIISIIFTHSPIHSTTCSVLESWIFETQPIVVALTLSDGLHPQMTPIACSFSGTYLHKIEKLVSLQPYYCTPAEFSKINSITEIIYTCVNRVRSPVTHDKLSDRKRQSFMNRNMKILSRPLNSYVTQFDYGCATDIYFSLSRLRSFISLHTELKLHVEYLYSCYQKLQQSSCNAVSQLLDFDDSVLDSSVLLSILQEEIFPEHALDVFDEVAERDVEFTWDYDIDRLLQLAVFGNILTNQVRCLEVQTTKFEKMSTLDEAPSEQFKNLNDLDGVQSEKFDRTSTLDELQSVQLTNANIPEGIKSAQLTKENSLEDAKLKHSTEGNTLDGLESGKLTNLDSTRNNSNELLQKSQDYLDQCISQILSLSIPTSVDTVSLFAAMKNAIASTFDNADDWRKHCMEGANIPTNLQIQQVGNPFLSQDANERWNKILDPLMLSFPIEPTNAVAKGKTKGVKPQLPTKGCASEHQSYSYFAQLYRTIESELTANILEVLVDTDQSLQVEESSQLSSLSKLACIRQSDICSDTVIHYVTDTFPFFMDDKYPADVLPTNPIGVNDSQTAIPEQPVEVPVDTITRSPICRIVTHEQIQVLLAICQFVSYGSKSIIIHVSAENVECSMLNLRKFNESLESLYNSKYESIECNFKFDVTIVTSLNDYFSTAKDIDVNANLSVVHLYIIPTYNNSKILTSSIIDGSNHLMVLGNESSFTKQTPLQSGSRLPTVWSEYMHKTAAWIDFIQQPIAAFNRTLAIIAGTVSINKFKVIDKMIDLGVNLFVYGEVSIPFLAVERQIKFPNHNSICKHFEKTVSILLRKARLRGVSLQLPVDLLVVSNEVDDDEHDLKLDYYSHVDSDIDGHVNDVGPITQQILEDSINESQKCITWGVADNLQSGPCQQGNRAISKALMLVTESDTRIFHSWVILNDTDSTFSLYNCDLSKSGSNNFTSNSNIHFSRSSIFLWALFEAESYKSPCQLIRRSPITSEFSLQTHVISSFT